MAKRTIIVVEDDLDGSTDGVTTHRFSLDNTSWEIDLSEPNLDRLRQALQPFITAAVRLPAKRGTRTRPRRTRAEHAGSAGR
ncbi:Lsr2 dimerization domain-containing protein [Phytohabitans kaempferiae]|uniref:Histone-like nucleoid-structuring protein Lsr2 n=1 Tax=Phytohabitans kaempferiae TaxID=1620943 RepID=A0ABV6MBM6_9ACTN